MQRHLFNNVDSADCRNKSFVSAVEAQVLNPETKVQYKAHFMKKETEDNYNAAFWNGVDLVICAVQRGDVSYMLLHAVIDIHFICTGRTIR